MEDAKKVRITARLREYILRYDSQNKAANSLKNVSPATISQMLNEKWELIKDDMWRNVASQIGYEETEWVGAETRDFKILTSLLRNAQMHSNVFAIVGDAGTGKSFALKTYAENNRKVHIICCAEYWTRKVFLQELLASMGKEINGYNLNTMMVHVIEALKKEQDPLVILDEADKLSDSVLYFFITLYNQLEDHAGIVLCATKYLERRLKSGIAHNKKGYNEIYSRVGRKCVELKGLSRTDITAVCMANGITEKEGINDIMDDCESDLRRVKRKIHALKNMA
ncbi:MAG TPA: ATP-binding protein [Prolixibacteraceae bacterium]